MIQEISSVASETLTVHGIEQIQLAAQNGRDGFIWIIGDPAELNKKLIKKSSSTPEEIPLTIESVMEHWDVFSELASNAIVKVSQRRANTLRPMWTQAFNHCLTIPNRPDIPENHEATARPAAKAPAAPFDDKG